MGLTHDGQADPVTFEDGTLSRWLSSSRICRGWDFVKMAKQLPYLSRMGLCQDVQAAPVSVKNRKKNKIVKNINLTKTIMDFIMAPMSFEDGTLSRWARRSHNFRGWDFITMAKQIPCLSRIERRKMLAT